MLNCKPLILNGTRGVRKLFGGQVLYGRPEI